MPEEDFEWGDYDTEDDVTPVETTEALPYPDVVKQDYLTPDDAAEVRGFTSRLGVTPNEAIATARLWSHQRRFMGVGQCLATVRQYYRVASKYGTASASWAAADHKAFSNDGRDAPRGAPVWWTGGSRGAGHVAISIGGGYCWSTDWLSAGRIDIARINDITSHWNLDYRGHTREINDVVVWMPALQAPVANVRLKNLKPGKRNQDVLQLKKRLHEKGYRGFILKSKKFGKGTQKAYAKFQRHLGYEGKDANGVPGRTSLKKLGFKVL